MIRTLLLAALIVLLAYIGSHRQLSKIQYGVVALLFALGASLVVAPQFANQIANALNVGRGADLLLYLTVLAAVYTAAYFYFRFTQIEQALIAIVRQLALLTPMRSESDGNKCGRIDSKG
jgi:hypothetical protein